MKSLALSLLASILLVGCGGSSSTKKTPTNPTPPNGGATTKVITDEVKEYAIHGGETLKYSIKVTAYHQNDNSKDHYNLWDYSFSNSKDNYEIFFDSYYKSTVQAAESYSHSSTKLVYELDARSPNPARDRRKITMLHNQQDPLASIRYNSVVSRTFKSPATTAPTLTGIELKQEQEDLFFNQDPCSELVVSKGDIITSFTDSGFWQVGDKIKTEITILSQPALKCNEGTAELLGTFNDTIHINSTDTLTSYIPTLSFHDKKFDSVLEFTSEGKTTAGTGASALGLNVNDIIQSSNTKRYYQLNTGGVAEKKRLCTLEPITSDSCKITDAVAINIPQIPQI